MPSQPTQPLNTSGLDLDAIGPPPQAGMNEEALQLARMEQAVLFDGKKREHERTQAIKDRIHFWIVSGIAIAALLFLVLIVVRVIHMTVDKEHLWLSDAQVGLIDTVIKFMLSSAFGGLIFKKIGNALA